MITNKYSNIQGWKGKFISLANHLFKVNYKNTQITPRNKRSQVSEANSEHCQIPKMELFVKKVHG